MTCRMSANTRLSRGTQAISQGTITVDDSVKLFVFYSDFIKYLLNTTSNVKELGI
jgi:hypothetical protein